MPLTTLWRLSELLSMNSIHLLNRPLRNRPAHLEPRKATSTAPLGTPEGRENI
jgi:hypothetical protein